jgi:leucyl-tRNA synthetase
MFSYPSEKKLHIGHWWNYGPTDTFARFQRMKGRNVFEPMGFDAFGLPAENFAIKHHVHPGITTQDSVNHIREQLKLIGAMYDWNHEVDTSKPEYYKWTQWLFLELFKAGAAYRKNAAVNWCPNCQTVLANEQVDSSGNCDRCKTTVTVRDLEQWFFRITDFADKLLEGLDKLDWPEPTKAMQKHWIGRSEGTEILFKVVDCDSVVRCFTTRADTLFGVTYVVIAPENPLVSLITSSTEKPTVDAYIQKARNVSEIDRLSTEREKSGVFTGAYAVNPANGKKVPIWVADYVLGSYGTGAVMAVPAHDQRDYEFAVKYDLPITWVIGPVNPHDDVMKNHAYEEYGVMHDSGQFDGMTSLQGKNAVTSWLDNNQAGKGSISYRLRDWLISRQRYWGAPIPIIHCASCGPVGVPEQDLPVLLPQEVEDFTPRGASPLGAHEPFMQVACPSCGKPARRDPDTMDTFVDSSWYFLRYPSAKFSEKPFDSGLTSNWLPVDVYVGGPEHATGHLIYSRYITKFLHSRGYLPFDEPFQRLVHQGIITHQGQRMSKSTGNVVNPDPFVEKYGSDCFRLYLMFMGDYTVGGDWSDEGIVGVRRFQNRVWRLFAGLTQTKHDADTNVSSAAQRELTRLLHYTIKEVTGDLQEFRFNTAISRLMELTNALYSHVGGVESLDDPFLREILSVLARLVAPLAPHMGEELWKMISDQDGSVFDQPWPEWSEAALGREVVTFAVQVNGKFTDTFEIAKGSSVDAVSEAARELSKVKRQVSGKEIRKTIFVPDKIINFVVVH